MKEKIIEYKKEVKQFVLEVRRCVVSVMYAKNTWKYGTMRLIFTALKDYRDTQVYNIY